jgi:hypothetical protein
MTNLLRKVRHQFVERSIAREKRRFSAYKPQYGTALSLTEAVKQFPRRDDLYAYLHHFFFYHLPQSFVEHRKYFSENARGFGEESFHSMWYLLLREFRPKTMLEIGVFRGQVVSLWTLIAKTDSIDTQVHCISPFTTAGDAVSDYPVVDFLADVALNFEHFNIPMPTCVKALSTDADAVDYLRRHKFDCIYIDGSHDYEVVLADYRNSVTSLNDGGLLVMDDSSLETDFAPPSFSFAGHPGPSAVARRYADKELTFVAGVGHQNIYIKR